MRVIFRGWLRGKGGRAADRPSILGLKGEKLK